jgi:hypothetical protein
MSRQKAPPKVRTTYHATRCKNHEDCHLNTSTSFVRRYFRKHTSHRALTMSELSTYWMHVNYIVGRDSVVSIATRYGLDGPGSNSSGGEIFRTSPDRPWGHPASYSMGTGSFPRLKRPGRGVDHSPLSRTEVKERVELYLYSPSGPLLRWTLHQLYYGNAYLNNGNINSNFI